LAILLGAFAYRATTEGDERRRAVAKNGIASYMVPDCRAKHVIDLLGNNDIRIRAA
jgi:hypothetical protein